MKPLKSLLGIVIYEHAIGVADVECADGSYIVRKSAEYALPNGVTIENLNADSVGFHSFLRDKNFKSKKAIIGVSAKHIVSTLLELPRIENPQVRHDTIKIKLERKIQIDFQDIVFDYDEIKSADQGSILILMLLKKKLEQIKDLLRAVKITPARITNTSLGLNLAAHSDAMCHVVEYPSSFELCLFRNGNLCAVRYIAKDYKQSLNIESAKKISQQISRICLSLGITENVRYCIWSPDNRSLKNNKKVSGILSEPEFRDLKSSSESILGDLAAELAGNALLATKDRINFLNGRHGEQKPTLVSKWYRKAITLAAVLLVLIGIFILSWHSDQRRIADYQQQLDSMQTNVKTAENMIKQISYARQWFQQKPEYLDILRELTLSFPENSDIWITSLAVDESFNQILSGRTVSEDAVLDVVEALRAGRVFDNIKLLYIRKMGKETDIMTFAINLHYRKDH